MTVEFIWEYGLPLTIHGVKSLGEAIEICISLGYDPDTALVRIVKG